MIVNISIVPDQTEELGQVVGSVRINEEAHDIYDLIELFREAVEQSGVEMPENFLLGLERE